jgi:uncharacterized protein YbcI
VSEPEEAERWTDARTAEWELGAELVRLMKESYGTTAGEFQVLLSEDAVVVFLDDLELQRSEKFLIERGQGETVISTRLIYQQAVESTFRAAVERIIGRRVVSFASITKLDPNYSVEIFRLAPATDRNELAEFEDQ